MNVPGGKRHALILLILSGIFLILLYFWFFVKEMRVDVASPGGVTVSYDCRIIISRSETRVRAKAAHAAYLDGTLQIAVAMSPAISTAADIGRETGQTDQLDAVTDQVRAQLDDLRLDINRDFGCLLDLTGLVTF